MVEARAKFLGGSREQKTFLGKLTQSQPLALKRGWFPEPAPGWGASEAITRLYPDLPGDENFFEADKPIYLDCSCLNPTDPRIASAGAAAVQIGPDGVITRAAIASIPNWVAQTAAVGEHRAAQIASALSPTGSSFFVDCMSVLKSMHRGAGYTRDWRRPLGGLWESFKFGEFSGIKTKAHRSKIASETG